MKPTVLNGVGKRAVMTVARMEAVKAAVRKGGRTVRRKYENKGKACMGGKAGTDADVR